MNNLGILIMAALVVPATCVGMVWFVFRARQVAARANGMLERINDDDLGAFRAQLAADAVVREQYWHEQRRMEVSKPDFTAEKMAEGSGIYPSDPFYDFSSDD